MLTTASLGRPSYVPDMTQPQIRPAGITTGYPESAKDCLQWTDERPQTPADLKKYRQSTIHEPGKILRHYGTADDETKAGPFGAKSVPVPGESVADYIKCFPEGEISRWKLEQSEQSYASTKKEPLGKGFQRGHVIPEGMGTETAFGRAINAKQKDREGQARPIIFPNDQDYDDDMGTHKMYVKSHSAYKPGEQRDREYDWQTAGVDPQTFRFGAVDKDDLREGVKKAMAPKLDLGAPQPNVVVSKVQEDFKTTSADVLGKVKVLGTRNAELPADHSFGMPSMKFPEPGVRELLLSSCPPEHQGADADLGKSLREGWRNVPTDRVFGVPTIRTDVPQPRKTSVTNTINYGNEPNALQLLRPPRSVDRGINEAHYVTMRSREEVKALVQEAGIDLDEDTFEKAFSLAAGADRISPDECSLDTFFKARHHMLTATLEIPAPF